MHVGGCAGFMKVLHLLSIRTSNRRLNTNSYVYLIVHKLVCRANVLIDCHYTGKLADFGFAYELPTIQEGRTVFTATQFARTEGYLAPELVHGQLSVKCDVYS